MLAHEVVDVLRVPDLLAVEPGDQVSAKIDLQVGEIRGRIVSAQAGSCGLEEDHYDLSMKISERLPLSRVREAGRDTLIITDGFTCRELIVHCTLRHALYLAEVIQMAMRQPLGNLGKEYVETAPKYAYFDS